jgi:hypothetical protein
MSNIILPETSLRNFVFIFDLYNSGVKYLDTAQINTCHVEVDIFYIEKALQTYYSDQTITIAKEYYNDTTRFYIVPKKDLSRETIQFTKDEFKSMYEVISELLPSCTYHYRLGNEQDYFYVLPKKINPKVLPLLSVYYRCEVSCFENILKIKNVNYNCENKKDKLKNKIEKIRDEIITIKVQTGLYLLEKQLEDLKDELKTTSDVFNGKNFIYL